MKERVLVIGAGINGLVAANYLQRDGYAVTVLESQEQAGGACAANTFYKDGVGYEYPAAATVLGFMQDFVYQDTGLAARLSVHAPRHPAVVWFESQTSPCLMFDDVDKLTAEVKAKWGETGDVAGYFADLERVTAFLAAGYRSARVPTLDDAAQALGQETAELWIAGSAQSLMDHYFSTQAMKVFCSLDVTESGPVSLHAPYSAFTIPLMGSGTVFRGKWGFVKGGLWQLVAELAKLNSEAGVAMITSACATGVSAADMTVSYEHQGQLKTISTDHVLFASDPLTAARLLNEDSLVASVAAKPALGTSGKLVMFFRKPIVWQDDNGQEDFDCAFKFIVAAETLSAIETAAQQVVDGGDDFTPGYYEIYCEGAAMRKLGLDRGYDCLSIFFKNMSFSRKGEELPAVKQTVESAILSKIKNKADLIDSVLFSPKDLSERFLFPKGNIDHIELCAGQTYFARNYSPTPEQNFYQFGAHRNVTYCAAGSYPCGSIAGTAGYMCARQLVSARALSG